MTKKTIQENQTLIAFWDKAFALSEEDQKQMLEGGGSDWKEIAPSEKLYQAACSLGKRNKVLDYGCGNAWASIIAAKSGCADVTAADAAPGAVQAARLYAAADRRWDQRAGWRCVPRHAAPDGAGNADHALQGYRACLDVAKVYRLLEEEIGAFCGR